MPAACCGCHHPVGQLVPLVLTINIWQRLHTFHTLINRNNDCYRPEMAEVLPSPSPSPNRHVEVEDTPPTSLPPPPLLPPAPRKALLGPPPPPVTPLTNTLRAMEKSIAQQTARIEAGLSAPAPSWGRAFAPARTSKKFKFFVSNREAADSNILLGVPEKPGWGAAFRKP